MGIYHMVSASVWILNIKDYTFRKIDPLHREVLIFFSSGIGVKLLLPVSSQILKK